jgi:transcription antitermination protein NusB
MAAGTATPNRASSRSAARLAAVQALYQMDMTGIDLTDVVAEFEAHRLGQEVEGDQYFAAEAAFFRDLVEGVVREQRNLDPVIDEQLAQGWRLNRVDSILRAVLRSGAFELFMREDVPARVVITEYVDIAHAFFGEDEPKVVNGILDRLARKARPGEFARPGAVDG